MLGHAPSKKEMPALNQNDIPYESSTDKSNLFAGNFSKVSSTVVSLKYINNKLKIMIIKILQIILTIIVIVIMINLPYRK